MEVRIAAQSPTLETGYPAMERELCNWMSVTVEMADQRIIQDIKKHL